MPPNLCKPTSMGRTSFSTFFGARSAENMGESRRTVVIQSISVLVALLVIVGFQYRVRTQLALESSHFNVEDDTGMLKGDPGLLYYLTKRVIEAGGGVPDDWSADPRIEYPDVVDVPATFTVGQEFLVAWCWKWFGGDRPLHVFITQIMAIVASLSALGVYLLGAELARSRLMGLFAAALSSTLPANFRTIGFILIREDLSLPLLALHFGLLARASRVRSAGSLFAAGVALGAAAATWHAMGFIIALEAMCFLAWFLWTDDNPLGGRRAWIVPACLAAFALLVPALATRHAILSLPLQISAAMLIAARVPALNRFARRGAAVGTLIVLIGLSIALGTDDFGHVFEVIWAKLRYMGVLPIDPKELSFEARMMWQGPFATLPLYRFWSLDHVSLVLGLGFAGLALFRFLRWRGGVAESLLAMLIVVGVVATWLIARLQVLPGLLLPVAAALSVRSLVSWIAGNRRGIETATLVGVLALHAYFFQVWTSAHFMPWYYPGHRYEIAALIEAIEQHVPEGEAIAADFVTSTAILAETGRPIVMQPKWETERSRERIRVFWEEFYRGTASGLKRLITKRFQCRWLLIDRFSLYFNEPSRYLGGLRRDSKNFQRNSPATKLLSTDDADLRSIPGYQLVWRSPRTIVLPNGSPTDFYRLYRLTD